MDAITRFKKQHQNGAFPGGQLVVSKGDRVIIDEVAGIASGLRAGEPQLPVTPETRFQVNSVSKPFVTTAVALLHERGLLDVHRPLSHFVPEWPKDRTVDDVLTHRSGILLPAIVADETRWGDRAGIRHAVATTPPRYKRGTIAYGPYEFGWILSEIVERVAGEPLPVFLAKEVFTPGKLDISFTTTAPVAKSYWIGGKREVAGVELSARWEEVQNAATTLATLAPGGAMIASARAVCGFYARLLGGQILKPETLAEYTRAHAAGFDRSNKIPLRIGRGFLLGAAMPSTYGWFGTSRCFGHAGAFCSVAGADPDRGVAFAYITNGNRGPYDMLFRSAPLLSAARMAS